MKANIRDCALCGSEAETFSDTTEKLYQCSNGACRQAAWGLDWWNDNQATIEKWRDEAIASRKLEAKGKK